MMNRFFILVSVIGVLVLAGSFTANAQPRSDKGLKAWTIHSSAFLSLREGGRSFSLDSNGALVKRSKNSETQQTVAADDLQQISKLLRQLDLSKTKTKTVKGKGINDWPYWGFTIELDGKSFLMEGLSLHDAKVLVLTKKQKQTFVRLKEKLKEVGAIR